VDANADTGGVVTSIECMIRGPEDKPLMEVDTDTIASGATGAVATAIEYHITSFSHCRFGLKFGTGDDTDTAPEVMALGVTFGR